MEMKNNMSALILAPHHTNLLVLHTQGKSQLRIKNKSLIILRDGNDSKFESLK